MIDTTHGTMSAGMRALLGFVAGVLSTLVFFELTLLVLHAIGFAPFGAYDATPVPPFGLPSFLSLSFWGGVWGILFAFVHHRFPQGTAYWMAAFLFGGILASFVALFIVAPMKGNPMGAGGNVQILLLVLILNGVWGIGTGVLLRWFEGRFGERRLAST